MKPMCNTQSYGALARSRARATGLVASALLLVISVDYATAAGTVPPTSDREDVSGTLIRNDGVADDKPPTINLIDATDAALDGPGELLFFYAIWGGSGRGEGREWIFQYASLEGERLDG